MLKDRSEIIEQNKNKQKKISGLNEALAEAYTEIVELRSTVKALKAKKKAPAKKKATK